VTFSDGKTSPLRQYDTSKECWEVVNRTWDAWMADCESAEKTGRDVDGDKMRKCTEATYRAIPGLAGECRPERVP
jgi:hypothetical protein